MRWNPDHYLKYADCRLRPALDLLARVPLNQAERITDLGCGTGSMYQALHDAFPKALITGVDKSLDMLDKARTAVPESSQGSQVIWQHTDVATWAPQNSQDLIYANAALHWLDDHEKLFERLFGFVRSGGVLAVQMPNQFDQPSHALMRDGAENGPWSPALKPLLRSHPVANPDAYYDWLKPFANRIDIWQTEYIHELHGADPVLDWISSTALKPLSDALDDDHRQAFVEALAVRLRKAYPQRPDGITLFPFKRMFIVARKA